jgi:hypothetical protein
MKFQKLNDRKPVEAPPVQENTSAKSIKNLDLKDFWEIVRKHVRDQSIDILLQPAANTVKWQIVTWRNGEWNVYILDRMTEEYAKTIAYKITEFYQLTKGVNV